MNMSEERITVLAVDDEQEILDIFSHYLSEDENFYVIKARSVGEALEILTHEDISAIISDYQMPGTNGIEFLSLLREQGSNLPFILFTGRGCEEVVIRALNLGADFYIVKGEEPGLQFQMLKKQLISLISKKKADEALAKSLKENRRVLSQLRATLEATEEGIVVTDRGGIIRDYNERFLLLWEIAHATIKNVPIKNFLERFSGIITDKTIIAEILKTGDEPRSLERQTLQCSDGRILELYIRPQQCDGRIIGTVYSFRDITSRVRAEMLLQESRERFRLLFEHSPVSHMVISPDGRIIEVNHACLLMMKRSRESVIQIPFSDIVDPESRPRFFACLKEVLKSNQRQSIEIILRDGDGAQVTVLADGNVVRDNEGKVTRIQCILRDITYQRTTEKRLLWTESLLGEIVSMVPFGLCVTRNADMEIFYHNKRFFEMWGPDIIGRIPRTGSAPTLKDFFSVTPGFQDHVHHSWKLDACLDPDIVCHDIELPGRRYVRVYSRPLSQDLGEERTLWAFEDITKFHDQEEEIRRYARKIEILSRISSLSGRAGTVTLLCELTLSALISVFHFEGGAFYLLSDDEKTSRMIAHTGLSKEYVLETSEIQACDFTQLYGDVKPVFTNTLSTLNPDFAKKWGVSGSAYIPVISGNLTVGFIHLTSRKYVTVPLEEQEILLGIGREIGNAFQRLNDQKLLREERKNLENLVHSIGDMVVVIDADTHTILGINEEVIRKTGIFRDELIGKTILETGSPYLTSLPLDEAGHESRAVKFTVQKSDGKRSVLETRITSGIWGSKNALFCLCSDITRSMETLEEIRVSEERISAIFLTSPIGIVLFDPGDQIIQANPAAITLFGIMGIPDLMRYSFMNDPNLSESVKEKIRTREAFSTEIAYDVSFARLEGLYKTSGSGTMYLRIIVTPVTFSISEIRSGFFMMIEDISPRYRIESEMRKLTRQLGQIMDASNDGFFVYHIAEDMITLSTHLKEMFGIFSDKEDYPLPEILERIHEKDKEQIKSLFYSLAQGSHTAVSLEIQLLNQRNEWIWVYFRGKVTGVDETGTPLTLAGAVTDITRRKISEQKLLESENFNRGLVDSLPDYLMVYDTSGTILFVNDSSTRAMKAMNGEIIGRNILDFIVPEMRPYVKMQSEKRFRGEIFEPYEVKMLRSDSSVIDAEIQASVIMFNEQPAILSVLTDVTRRKRNEEDLARYAETLKETVEALASSNKKLNLLSNVTRHDILNQIHIVMSYLALLDESSPDPEIEPFLLKIASAVGFIQRHIEFTRNYQEIGGHSPTWQSPGEIIRKMNFEGKDTRINLDNLEIYADPLLPKVFENLLDNAIRHGGHVTTISVSYEVKQDNALVIVWEDDGTGVPDDAKSRIFEHGYGKNTGLGLFLIREILALTGITIYETGIDGSGAQFCLLVPEEKYRFFNQ